MYILNTVLECGSAGNETQVGRGDLQPLKLPQFFLNSSLSTLPEWSPPRLSHGFFNRIAVWRYS